VEAYLTELLKHSSGLGAYALIFLWLVACGLGLPLPEDISLVVGGFLSRIGHASLPIMVVVAYLGILSGDSLIYLAGRRVSGRASQNTGFFARIVTPDKRAKVESLFQIHGQKIVMVARFLPGLRAVTYFTAGSAQMPYWRFIFWDGLAALLSAPLFVYLGWRFGKHLRWLMYQVKQGEKLVILGLLLLVLLYLVQHRYRRTRAAKASSPRTAEGPQASSLNRAPPTDPPKAPAEWAK
jgi:membrane protein DedA with SNARE-associated domain